MSERGSKRVSIMKSPEMRKDSLPTKTSKLVWVCPPGIANAPSAKREGAIILDHALELT